MQKRFGCRLVVVAMATALFGLGVPTASTAASDEALNMYSATVSHEQFSQLRGEGYDVVNPQPTVDGVTVDLVLSANELTAVEGKGIDAELLRTEDGATIREAARAQARAGFEVWRDYDGSDGLRRYLTEFEAEHEKIAKLKVIGQTLQGRDIVAMRLTKESNGGGNGGSPIGDRPAVLYQGTTHAREWISTEVDAAADGALRRRLPGGQEAAQEAPALVRPGRQPGRLSVHVRPRAALAPQPARQRRRRRRLTNFDGVDLNRNYPEHWNYDDEGSNSSIASDTYRGPRARIRARDAGEHRVRRARSTRCWPTAITPTARCCSIPRAGRSRPRRATSRSTSRCRATMPTPPSRAPTPTSRPSSTPPTASSPTGRTTSRACSPGPRSSTRDAPSCGFVFPDDEALVQREFEINLPFAVDMARSAGDPARPDSHLGNSTEPFYFELVSEDPTFANNPLADFRFERSYGDPQPVDILARNSLGKVRLHYRINGGHDAATRTRIAGRAARTTATAMTPTTASAAARSPAPIPATRSRSGSPARRRRARAPRRRATRSPTRPSPSQAPARSSSPPRTTPGSARPRRPDPHYLEVLHPTR